MVLLVAAVLLTFYTMNQLRMLAGLEDFNNRVTEHVKIYKVRLLLFLITCLLSCILYILTIHTVFLYFALFDVVVLLPLYPNKYVLKKELMNDDIVFH